MNGFEYSSALHIRKHGPVGYRDYESYRDWLRDEFTFRCVYCLHREQWDNRGASLHIEHFVPVAVNPSGECDYSNLLYACGPCNEAKKAVLGLPNPCEVAFRDCLRITPDGHIQSLNDAGEKLRQVLRLNSEKNVRIRFRWIRTLEALRMKSPDLYREYMGFPVDLPDLRKKRAVNTKPEGAENCYFALRERGELPAVY
jgi:HNH endonuclease